MPKFVVEWRDDNPTEIIRVWTWEQWLQTPVSPRNWESAMCEARDEIDAYMQAKRGELD